MNIDVLTCTNGRPLCLELCKKWVSKQTYGKINHVIAEGKEIWDNMIDGLSRCTGDAVVIFEDDDYYPKDWVEICAKELESNDIFGQYLTYMYHVGVGGYGKKRSSNNASALHSTSFKSKYIKTFINIIEECKKENNPFIDVKIWDHVKKDKFVQLDVRKVISMKGMPGKSGYSLKHKPYWAMKDVDYHKLKCWVGEDSQTYIDIIKSHVV